MVKYLQRKAQASFEPLDPAGTYPTAAAAMGTAVYLGHNAKHTVNDTANKIERRPSTSAKVNVQGYYLGLKSFRNTMEFETIHFGPLGLAVGGVTTTGVADPWTHTLSELNKPNLGWFNIEHCWDGVTTDEARIYNGCIIDNLTLSCTQGEPVVTSMDYIAAYMYAAGSARESLTEVTTNPYMWHESSILFDLGSSGDYTTPVELINLKDWSLKVSNSLIAEGRCKSAGGNAISKPQATKRDYELNLTWDLDEAAPNDDLYDALLAATEIAYQVYVYRSATDYLKFTIEDAQVQTAPDNMDAEGDLVPQTVNITGGKFDATGANVAALDAYDDGAGFPWFDKTT